LKRDAADITREKGPDALRQAFDRSVKDRRSNGRGQNDKPPGQNGSDTWAWQRKGVSLEDFYAYMPMHNYIFVPSRELWPAASVNARVSPVPVVDPSGNPKRDKDGVQETIPATKWLDRYSAVEQITWAPGFPAIIENQLISEGGWIERRGCKVFNLYRPSVIVPKAGDAAPWLDLVRKVFPSEADHIVSWFAQRRQRPAEKVNHALVLGGKPGIGKDTILEPVKRAVGPWNFIDVSPGQVLGRFNGFLKSVILRINEVRDLGDFDRFALHDHMKVIIAAPPDVLRVDEKNLREYYVPNLSGVVITTNHKADGIYLPPDDRRHFVAWSNLSETDFTAQYWHDLYGWYANGGHEQVAAYLDALDISSFDPKAPPPKTPAFWEIVDASRAPEDAELADAIDALDSPPALTLEEIASRAQGPFAEWLRDRKNARRIPHRLESCGYVAVRNEAAKDGLWKIGGRRQVIYAKVDLLPRERMAAASDLTQR
jgi:Family of unknown function (DUF5906)